MEYYTSKGHKVFALCRNESADLPAGAVRLVADLRDEGSLCAVIAEAERHGGFGVLVNAAGIKRDALTLIAGADDADRHWETNIRGTFLLTREAVKAMKRQHFGRVITLSSVAVPLASPGSALYGMSKAALEHMSNVMAAELAATNITFNTIGISWCEFGGMAEALSHNAFLKMAALLTKPAAVSLEQLALAIDFFASPVATEVTSQVIYFGGVR